MRKLLAAAVIALTITGTAVATGLGTAEAADCRTNQVGDQSWLTVSECPGQQKFTFSQCGTERSDPQRAHIRFRACSWHYRHKYRVGFMVQNTSGSTVSVNTWQWVHEASRNGVGNYARLSPELAPLAVPARGWFSVVVEEEQEEFVSITKCFGLRMNVNNRAPFAYSPMQHGNSDNTPCTRPAGWGS